MDVGLVFETKWERTPATDLVGIWLRAEIAIKGQGGTGDLAARGFPKSRNSQRGLGRMVLAVSSMNMCGWFYLSPVRTWLIFFMPNSLVQPLALYEALAEPEPKWMV